MKQEMHSGSALMEFVFVMPMLFVMIMGVLQIAHIWMARQVVHYAAYCAARATLTANDSQQQQQALEAATRVCAWIATDDNGGIGAASGTASVTTISGWGKIPYSDSVKRRIKVRTGLSDFEYAPNLAKCPWQTRAVVEFDFPLLIPIAGSMMSYLVSQDADTLVAKMKSGEVRVNVVTGWTGQEETKNYSAPYITIKEMCILPKPYRTSMYPIVF